MNTCEYCGLETETVSMVFGYGVCADCVELAEITYAPEEMEA